MVNELSSRLPADRTLLIVDDDAPLRNRLARALEKRNFMPEV
ncbi:MAG TPA: two-component system response regulator, partial [Rhodospirillaceae bacterium]|nr:two-component system response regulator [Rhodospirillaceae bacterium]